MRKALGIIMALLLLPSALAAESSSLDAYIEAVSGGVKGFGLGLFPLGTTFGFEKYFQMLEDESRAEFQIELSFAFNNASLSKDYDYLTGRPRWMLDYDEQQKHHFFGGAGWNDGGERSLSYFNPRSSVDIYLDQGFWTNPLNEKGTLFNVRVGYNARYAMSLEEATFSLPGHGGLSSPVFVDMAGIPREPFTDVLPAYPWLNGSRNVFTDFLYLQLSLNMDRDTPTDAECEEGIGADLLLEAGPSWLFNNMTPMGVQSDYYLMSLYVEEKMAVFSVEQENGWNWMNMYIGHSNTLQYIAGPVVPENRLPLDRLRGGLQDRIWIHFNGPQFMAGDCYTNIEFNLYNTLMFGGIVNEVDGSTFAVELQSSFTARLQLRLFGFMRLEYQVGYDFIRGVWPDSPAWWQNSALQFYVSL